MCTSSVFAIGKGAKGPDVYVVQGMLKSLGYYAGDIDGKYGNSLFSGVKAFQEKKGLKVSGNVDKQTLQSILWAYSELQETKDPGSMSTPSKDIPMPNGPLVTSTPRVQLPKEQIVLSNDEKLMIDLVNEERKKQGLQTLSVDLQLTYVARLKSKDLIENQYFAHESKKYGTPFQMIQSFGILYQKAGENLACNQTTQKAHEALMNSPSHRENILKNGYTHIGIGIIEGGPCGAMYTQLFIGVANK